jgi:hypothetical protein
MIKSFSKARTKITQSLDLIKDDFICTEARKELVLELITDLEDFVKKQELRINSEIELFSYKEGRKVAMDALWRVLQDQNSTLHTEIIEAVVKKMELEPEDHIWN